MLSRRQQVARLRRLAARAIDRYPVADPRLRFIAHGENTTFRVDASMAGREERFLLRVHRPHRHGRDIDPVAAVRSELRWLAALRADTDLLVPEPVPTRDGELTTTVSSPDATGPRTCSLLRWMDGRIHTRAPRPVHLHRLGSAMARPLPAKQVTHLDAFIAAHEVAFALWFAGTAEVNADFRAQLGAVLADTADSLSALLT